tara:strand:+ start:1013 stop:1357 length:345 start_codon:yes stop_codon:yes gene_type:complete
MEFGGNVIITLKGEQIMNNKETYSYTIVYKMINGNNVKCIQTKLNSGDIYFRPLKDSDGNPLTMGEFFGQAGTLDRMFAESNEMTQAMELDEDNYQLYQLAEQNIIDVPNTTNI